MFPGTTSPPSGSWRNADLPSRERGTTNWFWYSGRTNRTKRLDGKRVASHDPNVVDGGEWRDFAGPPPPRVPLSVSGRGGGGSAIPRPAVDRPETPAVARIEVVARGYGFESQRADRHRGRREPWAGF